MGTMGYKHESMARNGERTTAVLARTQVNLKVIPGVDGRPEICQLVALQSHGHHREKGHGSVRAGFTSSRTSTRRSPTSLSARQSARITSWPT
jgi:hypothetical protein